MGGRRDKAGSTEECEQLGGTVTVTWVPFGGRGVGRGETSEGLLACGSGRGPPAPAWGRCSSGRPDAKWA